MFLYPGVHFYGSLFVDAYLYNTSFISFTLKVTLLIFTRTVAIRGPIIIKDACFLFVDFNS